MSNAELIATIRVRVDAATKGPWEAVGPFVAEFIAHARQDIPNLLTALEKSEAEVVRLQATITAVQSLVVPIISAGVGKIGTHYENCYERHAGCLAVYVVDVIEEGAK